MFQIGNTLVSLDLAERFFCCDLEKCLGACCIEGDEGAPITREEAGEIERALPVIEGDMLPRAVEEVRRGGVAYRDREGELVTTLLDGRNCAFSCYGPGGVCLCALEKASREGRLKGFRKPSSCALYPLRLKEYPGYTVVNYDRWTICRPAEVLGKQKGIRLYQFLEGPLTERFGHEWYDELVLNCQTYLKEYPDGLK